MATFAAVDIGSNSVRLKIARLVRGHLLPVHEDRAVTRLGAYRGRYNAVEGSFPVADRLDAWTLALPLHNRMSAADVETVVAALRDL